VRAPGADPGNSGGPRNNLEAASARLNLLAVLALTGDASKGGEVLSRLNT
jgi:hypothetical protein